VDAHQSERPAKPRRPMRRSMAELAASLQDAVTEVSPLERPLATQQCSPATSLEENAGDTINTSQDYANALADASRPLSFSSETADQPHEQEIESGTPRRDRQLLATVEAAQEYRAMAFKLMTANVKANLEYALKLTRLTTPFEFIELSTNHARKQFELIMSQTVALGALSRSLTMTNANE
jgi:hypothetical protein